MTILLTIFLACDEKHDHDHDTGVDSASSEPSSETSSEPSSEASSEPSGERNEEENIHTVDSPGMYFEPEDLVISVGDVVRFQMTATHNAIEVSKDTYDDRGMTPLEGGFQVDYGETLDVTFDQVGTHYYICQPHVTLDMIGTITVQ